eukprot:1157619-Pelagomonas_calceolata.AAC.13
MRTGKRHPLQVTVHMQACTVQEQCMPAPPKHTHAACLPTVDTEGPSSSSSDLNLQNQIPRMTVSIPHLYEKGRFDSSSSLNRTELQTGCGVPTLSTLHASDSFEGVPPVWDPPWCWSA